jgi:hypothetical protein
MLNVPVQAAAEGLPNTHAVEVNRRRLLLGLAAASTVAAAPVAVRDAIASSENPELLRLAAELPAVEARYVAAERHQRAVKERYSSQWPLAPDEIISPNSNAAYGDIERNFEGGALYRQGEDRPRAVTPACSLGYEIRRARRVLRSKRLDNGAVVAGADREGWETYLAECERAHTLAVEYEAECERIQREAQYERAWKETHAARDDMEGHIAAIMDQPDRTMEGLVIKAQALATWGRVEGWKVAFKHGQGWPAQIAASILRHAEGAES